MWSAVAQERPGGPSDPLVVSSSSTGKNESSISVGLKARWFSPPRKESLRAVRWELSSASSPRGPPGATSATTVTARCTLAIGQAGGRGGKGPPRHVHNAKASNLSLVKMFSQGLSECVQCRGVSSFSMHFYPRVERNAVQDLGDLPAPRGRQSKVDERIKRGLTCKPRGLPAPNRVVGGRRTVPRGAPGGRGVQAEERGAVRRLQP